MEQFSPHVLVTIENHCIAFADSDQILQFSPQRVSTPLLGTTAEHYYEGLWEQSAVKVGSTFTELLSRSAEKSVQHFDIDNDAAN